MYKNCLFCLFVLLNIGYLCAQNPQNHIQEEFSYKKLSQLKVNKLHELLEIDTSFKASFSIEDIQEKLPNEETAFIEYFWNDSNLVVLGATAQKYFWYSVRVDTSFQMNLNNFMSNLQNKEYAENEGQTQEGLALFIQQSRELYEEIISPVLNPMISQYKIDKLIISPDGALNQLSFEALLNENLGIEKSKDYSDLPYLFRTYDIRYEHASGQWLSQRSPRGEARSLFAGFVINDLPYKTDFPFPDNWSSIHEKQTLEIRKIVQGSFFEGQDANEFWFKRFGRRFKLLYLFAPFEANERTPLSSTFLFQPYQDEENEDRNQDGKLYLSELKDIRMRSEFVFISGLSLPNDRTAYEQSLKAMLLAFQQAGCPAIQANNWPSDGLAETTIVLDFFQKLEEELPKDEALRLARLHYLENNEHTHPYYWASMVLYGPPTPINFGDIWAYLTLWGVFIISLLGLGQFLRWKRKIIQKK